MTRTTRPVAPSLALLLLAALLLAQRTAIATIAADDADAAGGATAAAARPASTSPPPPLGTNLAAVTDWTAQYPFVNHMRMARTWWSGTQDQWEDGRALPLDAQGNVRALASNQLARTILFTGVPADPALLGKTFVVRYQGDGDLAYSNAEVVSRSKGRDVVRLASSGEPSLIIALTRTNRRKPLSNVHLAPLGGVCLSNRYASVSDASACTNAADYVAFENAGNRVVFMPEFLASLRPYRILRFMDWQRTNDSPSVTWKSRPLPTRQVYSTTAGVPLELMIDLANALGADPWLCVPHLADDGWARGLGALLASRLDPARKIYLEYSNEVWNGGFSQTGWARDKGKAAGLHMPENDETLGMLRFYAARAAKIFSMVAVGGGKKLGGGGGRTSSNNRLVRVLSTQAAVPWFTQQMLAYKPGVADAVAIAPYFGLTLTSPEQAAEIKRLGVSGTLAWVATGSSGANTDLLDWGTLPQLDEVVAEHKAAALAGGVSQLLAYEGGQHFVSAGGASGDEELEKVLDALNRAPEIKQVYLSYLQRWHQRSGGGLFVHFLACDRWSQWGRWGAQEYPTQPRSSAPKLDALLAWAAGEG